MVFKSVYNNEDVAVKKILIDGHLKNLLSKEELPNEIKISLKFSHRINLN
jgi:hypothetical protein